MRHTRILSIIAVILIILAGYFFFIWPTIFSMMTEFQEPVKRDGSLTFRSWDGKWQGTDSDCELTFMPNQVVYLSEYGDGISRYQGTYHLVTNGEVTVQIKGRKLSWPVMLLKKDWTSLYLTPRQESELTSPIRGHEGFWPFRPVTSTEETKIRDRIGSENERQTGE